MRDITIEQKILEGKVKDVQLRPRHNFWASDLGHPCERYLYHSIVDWDKKKKPDPHLAFIFEGGRLIEEMAINDFRQAGIPVYTPEINYFTEELSCGAKITGKLDIRAQINGKIYTGEIKSISLKDFVKINDWKDFLKSKSYWLWKYPAQIQLYLYMRAEEKGFFYLKSVPQFKPKFLWVELDFEYVEELLQKAERVWTCIQKKELPKRIEKEEICKYCDFAHICLPEITTTPLEFSKNNEIEEIIDRLEELAPLIEEYKELDEKLKKLIEGKEKLVAGKYLITGKWVERKQWIIPEEIKRKYGELKITKYWRKKIVKL